MSKRTYELFGAAALVLICIGVLWFLWTNDPAHRAARLPVPAFTPRPTQTALPTRLAGPYMAFDHVLIAELGDYARTTEDPGVVVCEVHKGQSVSILGAARTLDAVLYLQISAGPDCDGWIDSVYVSDYEPWREGIQPGERVFH